MYRLKWRSLSKTTPKQVEKDENYLLPRRYCEISYCFLASQENSARIKDDLSMLNQSLRKCVFALEPGR